MYLWPAGKGAHTNAAAGVAIAVNNKMFSDQYRRDVWNAPEDLQGRAGAVRFTKRNCFHWRFITAYFPVNGQDPEGSASLTKWIDSVLSQLPTNCIPIIGTDANGKLEWTRITGYLVKEDAGHVVGPHQPEIETQNGKMFRELLCKHYMQALDTWHETASGATFWSHENRGSRIDYLCAPRHLPVKVCSLWRRSAHKLQLSTNAKLRDHTPVFKFVSFHTKSHVHHAPLAENPIWHKDALMNAWVSGRGENAFVQVLEDWAGMQETQHILDTFVSHGEVDKAWQFKKHGVTVAAKKHFSGKQRQQRRGKFQASPDTAALARQKQVSRTQLTQTCCGTLMHACRDTFLPLLLRQWQAVIQLQKLDKKLAKSRRADKRRQTQAWCQEMELCASRHEWAAVWRVRLLALMWVLNLEGSIVCNVLSGQSN